jgi:hypothetical protein
MKYLTLRAADTRTRPPTEFRPEGSHNSPADGRTHCRRLAGRHPDDLVVLVESAGPKRFFRVIEMHGPVYLSSDGSQHREWIGRLIEAVEKIRNAHKE